MRCIFLFFFNARNNYLFGWKRFVYILKGFCLGCELPRRCLGAFPGCKRQRGWFRAGLGLPGPSNLCIALSRTAGFWMLVYMERRWIRPKTEPAGCRYRLEPGRTPMFGRHHLRCCVLVPFQPLSPPYRQGKGIGEVTWASSDGLQAQPCANAPPAVAGSGWKEQAPWQAGRRQSRRFAKRAQTSYTQSKKGTVLQARGPSALLLRGSSPRAAVSCVSCRRASEAQGHPAAAGRAGTNLPRLPSLPPAWGCLILQQCHVGRTLQMASRRIETGKGRGEHA